VAAQKKLETSQKLRAPITDRRDLPEPPADAGLTVLTVVSLTVLRNSAEAADRGIVGELVE
jgi:hypothetical protein